MSTQFVGTFTWIIHRDCVTLLRLGALTSHANNDPRRPGATARGVKAARRRTTSASGSERIARSGRDGDRLEDDGSDWTVVEVVKESRLKAAGIGL